MSAAMGFFSKGLKSEFETAVVNEPSVFEPLKFYCISYVQCGKVLRNKLHLLGQFLVDTSLALLSRGMILFTIDL